MPELRIEQTLHGYRDGHELLATSRELAADARRAMSILSDLSGDEVARGFREYLTGYPVPGTTFYALARTWYASEMKRPGCVWTHTLLLSPDVMNDAHRSSELIQLFRRPQSAKDLAPYQDAIVVAGAQAPTGRNRPRAAPDLAAEVVDALYAEAGKSILVLGEDAAEFEDLVLALWEQQWASLKARFSFSTGSFAFRTIDGAPFDLQIVPRERWKKVLRGSHQPLVALYHDESARPKPPEPSTWQWTTVADLYSDDCRLREFLRKFSGDVPADRRTFGSLARVFSKIDEVRRHRAELGLLLDIVGQSFPGNEAVDLKLALVGPPMTTSHDLLPDLGETDRVKALCIDRNNGSFALVEMRLSDRARRCFFPRPGWRSENLRWLQSALLNQEGAAIRADIASSMSASDLLAVFSEDPGLAAELLFDNPSRLLDPDLWAQPRTFQRACLEVVTRLDEEHRSMIVSAMAHSRAFALGNEAIELLGEEYFGSVLSALNSALLHGADVALDTWTGPASRLGPTLCDWLTTLTIGLDGRVLRTLIAGAAPEWVLSRVDASSIAAALLSDDSRFAYDDPGTAGLALVIALSSYEEDAALVASRCFEVVHAALMRDALPWIAWSRLEPLLPAGGVLGFFEWDNAEKLRRTYADHFADKTTWSKQLFWGGLTNPETKELVLAYCRHARTAWRLL